MQQQNNGRFVTNFWFNSKAIENARALQKSVREIHERRRKDFYYGRSPEPSQTNVRGFITAIDLEHAGWLGSELPNFDAVNWDKVVKFDYTSKGKAKPNGCKSAGVHNEKCVLILIDASSTRFAFSISDTEENRRRGFIIITPLKARILDEACYRKGWKFPKVEGYESVYKDLSPKTPKNDKKKKRGGSAYEPSGRWGEW